MPRSLMPALAVLRMRKSARDTLNIVFDADGLAADERVDFGGLSPHSITYRFLRDIEGALLRRSDAVLTRTESARSILLARAGSALKPQNCHVVSNGVDAGPFTDALQHFPKTATKEPFTLCYCGSIGAQYRLPEMLDIACKMKDADPGASVSDIFAIPRRCPKGLERTKAFMKRTGSNVRLCRPRRFPRNWRSVIWGSPCGSPRFPPRPFCQLSWASICLQGCR